MVPAWEDMTVRGGEANFLSDAIADFPKRGLLVSELRNSYIRYLIRCYVEKQVTILALELDCKNSEFSVAEVVRFRCADREGEEIASYRRFTTFDLAAASSLQESLRNGVRNFVMARPA